MTWDLVRIVIVLKVWTDLDFSWHHCSSLWTRTVKISTSFPLQRRLEPPKLYTIEIRSPPYGETTFCCTPFIFSISHVRQLQSKIPPRRQYLDEIEQVMRRRKTESTFLGRDRLPFVVSDDFIRDCSRPTTSAISSL